MLNRVGFVKYPFGCTKIDKLKFGPEWRNKKKKNSTIKITTLNIFLN